MNQAVHEVPVIEIPADETGTPERQLTAVVTVAVHSGSHRAAVASDPARTGPSRPHRGAEHQPGQRQH
jgi:hypothetical protein